VVILSSGGKYEHKERFSTFMGAVMKNINSEITPADMDAAMMASGAFVRPACVPRQQSQTPSACGRVDQELQLEPQN
jgi:hypothetical protein